MAKSMSIKPKTGETYGRFLTPQEWQCNGCEIIIKGQRGFKKLIKSHPNSCGLCPKPNLLRGRNRELQSIPAQIEEQIQDLINPNKDSKDLVLESKTIQLTREQLALFNDGKWISSLIVDAYTELINDWSSEPQNRNVLAFKSFFFKYMIFSPDIFERVLAKSCGERPLLENELIFIPISINSHFLSQDNHWILIVIEVNLSKIEVYDSLNSKAYKTARDESLRMIKKWIESVQSVSAESRTWQTSEAEFNGQQKDTSSGGVFVMQYMNFLIRRGKADFVFETIPYFRKRIVWDLKNKKLFSSVDLDSNH